MQDCTGCWAPCPLQCLPPSEVWAWQGWKSEGVQTLAKSLAAFCRYCQSIHVPRLFMTLSWIFSWIRWYVCASSCKLLLWFSHYRVQRREKAAGVPGRWRSKRSSEWPQPHLADGDCVSLGLQEGGFLSPHYQPCPEQLSACQITLPPCGNRTRALRMKQS